MARGHQKGTPGSNPGGRPKGALTRTTVAAKEVILWAADQLGGGQRIVDWAREDPKNEQLFWSSIFTKVVPYQVSGDKDNPIVHKHILAFRSEI